MGQAASEGVLPACSVPSVWMRNGGVEGSYIPPQVTRQKSGSQDLKLNLL